jgi:superfamily II DNA or RNA helicase
MNDFDRDFMKIDLSNLDILKDAEIKPIGINDEMEDTMKGGKASKDNKDNNDKGISIESAMKKKYSHPDQSDPDIQYKVHHKREFVAHRTPDRPLITDNTSYEVIDAHRKGTCGGSFVLHAHQGLLSNMINPDTPYKGLVVFHGLGTGKTCVGVSIAENFKDMVMKYNTKIYILVPGALLKEAWKGALTFCTGDTYKENTDKHAYVNDREKKRQEKVALNHAMQYYKIMSHRSFYKRVIGEKIVEKREVEGSKTKTVYRKTDDGEFERDIAIDRIYNLNNSIVIVDEAHNLTNNNYGKALEKILNNSINCKVVLLTATPMKNLGSDIIGLINFVRPSDSPLKRDMIFNSHKNYLMDFKEGGMEYFKKMISGYISHVRGSDPLVFAKRIDKGVVPKGLQFTNLIRCVMAKFQRKVYDRITAKLKTDDNDEASVVSVSFHRESEAIANMVFPGLNKNRTGITGYYGRNGIRTLREQLKVYPDLINGMINDTFFGGRYPEANDLIYMSSDNLTVTGKIYSMPYLKFFSVKFYTSMKKLNRLVYGKKGAQTAFIYSNLVRVGINVFQEVLLQNGYLEYNEDENYQIRDDTVCYYCGKTYKEHKAMYAQRARAKSDVSDFMFEEENEFAKRRRTNITDSDKEIYDVDTIGDSPVSTEKYKTKPVPYHKFAPATFISVTGAANEDDSGVIVDDKTRILNSVFNRPGNREGRYIKLVLGSQVMSEGVSLKNVGEVHILDVHYHLGRVDQIVGRGIRWCSHYSVMSEQNVFPAVNVYKYVVALDEKGKEGLSTEEDLYRKAELKYVLIKKIERAMKESAIDCSLNMAANVFSEEVRKYKNCSMHKDSKQKCPAICDYQKCEYKCDNVKLNREYYDPKRNVYKVMTKDKMDYSTFSYKLAKPEIEYAKSKIKEMYIVNPVYTLYDILDYVRSSYSDDKHKSDLFDEFFVFKALDDMIPITENEFNNYKDVIIDKNNTQGYLIYRDEYYIFQPFDQHENVPLYYRVHNTTNLKSELSLNDYLSTMPEFKDLKVAEFDKETISANVYDFESTREYYDAREEFKYVGIIDKETSRRKSKTADELKDVFKIRERLPKILDKKRGTGIPSIKGAVCATSKSKEYLDGIAKKVGISKKDYVAKDGRVTRHDVCMSIKTAMLLKEKYGTTKNGDKITYVRIPANHSELPFPYNLEDRVEHIINDLKNDIKFSINISKKTIKKKEGPEQGMPSYSIEFDDNTKLKNHMEILEKYNAQKDKGKWIILVE